MTMRPIKQLIKRCLRRRGLKIISMAENPTVTDFIRARNINTVIDVGANIGQFGWSLRKEGYKGTILSFEPIRATANTLKDTVVNDPAWKVFNLGLGESPGRKDIHIATETVFSSLLNATGVTQAWGDMARIQQTETVEIQRLDDVLPDVTGNALLKIDTQGYERQVLMGATRTLQRMTGVLLELPIIQLYEDNWSFHDALEFMHRAGFVPAQMHPVSFFPNDRISVVEVDCLFRRRDTKIDGPAYMP
jgi:FkbM family methyltransferase